MMFSIKTRIFESFSICIKLKIIYDCPSFQKNFICKHSLGLAVNLKHVKVPENAKYDIAQIGQKPKRGRPPKATKALMIQ